MEKNIPTPAIVMPAGLNEEDHAISPAALLWELNTLHLGEQPTMLTVVIIIPFFLLKWQTESNIVHKPQIANKMLYIQLRKLEKNIKTQAPDGKDGSASISVFMKPDA